MNRRKQVPRIQLNLNIPEDLHTDFELARKSAQIQFKQQALCEAMSVWVELAPYLNKFRRFPESELYSEKSFARAFVDWLSMNVLKTGVHTSPYKKRDKIPLNELQPYIEPLRELTMTLNRILDEMAKTQGSGKLGSELTSAGEEGAGADTTEPRPIDEQERDCLREIGDTLRHSATNRAGIAGDRRRVEEALDALSPKPDRDCGSAKRTA